MSSSSTRRTPTTGPSRRRRPTPRSARARSGSYDRAVRPGGFSHTARSTRGSGSAALEPTPVWTNPTLQAALDSVIRPFAAIISGHLHLFQTAQLADRPAQLTLGDGGTLLDPPDQGGDLPTFGPPQIPDAPAPTRGVTTFTFGWLLLHPAAAPGVFTGTRYEAGKGAWATCQLAAHEIDCRPLGTAVR